MRVVAEQPRTGRGRRALRVLALVAFAGLLATGGYSYRIHRLLRRAGELARAGKIAEARLPLENVAGAYLGQGRALAGLASLSAIEGDGDKARKMMAAARAHRRRRSPVDPGRTLTACFARGDYELARDVASFYWEHERSDEVDFYLGASELALGNLPAAQAALARVAPVSEHGDESNRLKERLKALQADPRRPAILDRQRRPLALQKIGQAEGPVELLQPALQELLTGDAGLLRSLSAPARRQTYVLTIDEELELLADAALGKYAGSLVVLDPSTGEVLAWATHPEATPRSYAVGGVPLPGHFEPGSVIKVATYLTALDAGVKLDDVFPLSCGGTMAVGGKPFFDWAKHGTVADIDQALAVSCNLAFARLGLLAGPDALRRTLGRFGFDRESPDPLVLGRTAPPGAGERALANLSIGLEELSGTPLQLALMAQAIANDGIARKPWVVREVLDVLDRRAVEGHPEPLSGDDEASRVASPEAIGKLKSGMRAVVESADGTGRRARMEALTLALKTGTAGDRAAGLDAIMVGFAPAEKPVLAFGLMAAHAGKAEYEGARIVRTFLESALERGKFPGHAAVPRDVTPGDAAPAPPPAAAPGPR